MPQLLRYVLVCIVLFTGLALAYPFRKISASSENKTPSPEENLVLRADEVDAAPPTISNVSVREGVKILDIVTSEKLVANTLSRLPSLDANEVASDVSNRSKNAQVRSLPSIDETVKRLPSIAEYQNQLRSKQASKTARPKRLPVTKQQFAKRSPAPRRYTLHRIVDGDDLKNLAASYLQDSDRHLEIFELNRDVIRHPDVLPLHSEIRIPVD